MDDDTFPGPVADGPDLPGLVDRGATAKADPDALRVIMVRHSRRRRRFLWAVVAVVAIAGSTAGYVVGADRGSSPAAVLSSGSSTPSHATGSGSSAGVSGFAVANVGQPFGAGTQLFVRNTADGIRVRAYRGDFPKTTAGSYFRKTTAGSYSCSSPGAPATVPAVPTTRPGTPAPGAPGPFRGAVGCGPPVGACLPAGFVSAQVSSDQVAGAVDSSYPVTTPNQPLYVVSAQVVGLGEPTPIGTVVVQAAPQVAQVRLSLGPGNADQMVPVHGFAVLAHVVAGVPVRPGPLGAPFPGATVGALDASGKVLASVTLPGAGSAEAPPGCGPLPRPLSPGPPRSTTTSIATGVAAPATIAPNVAPPTSSRP